MKICRSGGKASRLEQDIVFSWQVVHRYKILWHQSCLRRMRDLQIFTKAAKLRQTQREPKPKGMSGALFLHGEGIRMPLDVRTPRKEVQRLLGRTDSGTVHK
jgi:hypothetical protein